MQYVNIDAAVKCYVNSFYFVLCQWLCLVVMKNVWCCPLQMKIRRNQECE